MMPYYQTKFGCKTTSSLEDIVKIVTFWLYKSSLWPWHWKQWTNIPAWHSGLWCCITIPGLATKCSVVQKILSRQTLTDISDLHCHLDLERSYSIFPQDTPAYDAVLLNQTKFSCKRTSSLEDRIRIVFFFFLSPRCDRDIEDNEPIFPHDTSPRDNTQPYQVW